MPRGTFLQGPAARPFVGAHSSVRAHSSLRSLWRVGLRRGFAEALRAKANAPLAQGADEFLSTLPAHWKLSPARFSSRAGASQLKTTFRVEYITLLAGGPSMEVDVTFHGDVARVRIKGRIVDGKAADQLKQTLSKLLQDGKLNTIFDLWEVTWFDSLGIGILLGHYIPVAGRGGKVMLLGANTKIRQIVEMVRVADRFGWAWDLDEALAWFR
jgi:anti-anti-sigma factor